MDAPQEGLKLPVFEVESEASSTRSTESRRCSHESSESKASVSLRQWALFPFLGLLIIFMDPSMSYGLYKPALQSVLGLTLEESGDIASMGFFGGAILGFIPGILYDRYGYAVTLISGGIMATTGAFFWYYQLQDGGEEGSPGWLGLGLAFMMICQGSATQYFAGMCSVLCIFPSHLAGSLSAALGVLVSLGHTLMPLLWIPFLPGADETEAFEADGKTLTTLKPVAHFWLLMAAIYLSVTLIGLSVFPCIQRNVESSACQLSPVGHRRGRLYMIRQPAPIVLFMVVILSLSVVQTFMVNGFGSVSQQAGLGHEERTAILNRVGFFGMVSHLLHGVIADVLRRRTRAREAGTYIMYIVAVSCGFAGFLMIVGSASDPARDLGNELPLATCLISFCFGGIWGLLPGTLRRVFGAEALGFWLGIFFFLIGFVFFWMSRLGAAYEWGIDFFKLCSLCSGISVSSCVYITTVMWGRDSV